MRKRRKELLMIPRRDQKEKTGESGVGLAKTVKKEQERKKRYATNGRKLKETDHKIR